MEPLGGNEDLLSISTGVEALESSSLRPPYLAGSRGVVDGTLSFGVKDSCSAGIENGRLCNSSTEELVGHVVAVAMSSFLSSFS